MIVYLKRTVFSTLATSSLISAFIFIGYEAKTIDQYVDALYLSATLMISTFHFVIFLWKMDNLFKLIDDFEHLIKERKIKSDVFHYI